jgi:hypothetical protein
VEQVLRRAARPGLAASMVVRMWTLKQKPLGRGSVLLLAGILLVPGIGFVWFAATTPLPSEADLTEVRGALRSYSCHGKSLFPVCDLILQEGREIWTDALYRGEANEMFRGRPVEIRAWIWPQASAEKSYGLSVNGREIRTNRYALRRDWIYLKWIYSLFGTGVIALAGFLFRSTRARASAGTRSRSKQRLNHRERCLTGKTRSGPSFGAPPIRPRRTNAPGASALG